MNRFLSFICIALTGCSVSVGTVPHKPPQIDATVTTQLKTPEFGRMEFNDPLDMDGVSMFFWPTELHASDAALEPACKFAQDYDALTESQKMSVKVCQVNMMSQAIDREFDRLRIEAPKIAEPFLQANCPALSTVPASSINDSFEWPEVEASDSRASQIEQCRKWKDDYTTLTGEGIGKIGTLKASIVSEVGTENWIEMNKEQSSLAIEPNGHVELTLRMGRAIYSTKEGTKPNLQIRDASYDPRFRLLKFEMNELDSKRNPTGPVYKITLERMEALGMARFTGDVRVVDADGKTLRSGSMQMSGMLARE